MTRRQVPVAFLALALVLTLQDSQPCAGTGDQAQTRPEGKIIVKDWKEIDEPGRISQQCDSVEPALAAEAERGFLFRIIGRGPDLVEGPFLRKLETPVHVLADRKFQFPWGHPAFRFTDGLQQLQDFARGAKQDCWYVSMEVVGCSKGPSGNKGVVIEYSHGMVNWKRAAWDALNEEDRREQERPPLALVPYWGQYKALVVRE